MAQVYKGLEGVTMESKKGPGLVEQSRQVEAMALDLSIWIEQVFRPTEPKSSDVAQKPPYHQPLTEVVGNMAETLEHLRHIRQVLEKELTDKL